MKNQRSTVVAKKLVSKANKVSPDDVARGRKNDLSSQGSSSRVAKVMTIGLGRRRSIVKNPTRSGSGLKEVSKTSSSIFTLPSNDRYYEDTVQSMKDKDEWEVLNRDDTSEGGKVMRNSRRRVLRVKKAPKKVSIANHQDRQSHQTVTVKDQKGSDDHSFLDSTAFCADRTLLFIGSQVHKVVEKAISALNQK